MDINNFIVNFASQFDDTDINEFASQTKFKELDEWSSLTSLSLIAMSDIEYNVKITGEDILNSNTIGDLYEIILSRIQ